MTVSVAWIGDSHSASVALAAQRDPPRGVEITFFSHTRRRLGGLVVQDGALRAGNENLRRALVETSGGLDRIEPECYDVFVLMALGFEFPLYCIRSQHYTRAVTERAVLDELGASLALDLVGKLRLLTPAPVWLLAMPLFSPQCAERPEVLTYARFLELAAAVFTPLGVEIVPQPASTRFGDCFTRPELARRPAAWRDGGALGTTDEDTYHKNQAFGRAVLDDLLERLARREPESGGAELARR